MKKICISKNWSFSSPDYEGTRTVDLPHDYIVTLERDENAPGGASNGFIPGTSARYTKYIMPADCEHTILDIDGAYMCTRVYFNESILGMHPHGYTPYLVDLTEHIKKGINNKLEITVLNMQPSTRWYSGSGIYRDVFLWTGGRVRIEPWDMFVYTERATGDSADIAVKMIVSSDMDCCADITLSVAEQNGDVILTEKIRLELAEGKNEREVKLSIANPKLWSCETPSLYRLDAHIEVDGKTEDEAESEFGIRTVTIDAENGLRINGKSLKLKGGCIHHDHGVLGSAEYPAAVHRKLSLLKDAGFNAIRVAHNPPSLAFLQECDRLGMIVMDEAFDMWNQPKNEMDYSLWFRDWWQRDISYMVMRDRNHPCVIAYSIGNEIIESDGNSEGFEWSKRLADEVRRYDNTRPVTAAMVVFYWAKGPGENAPGDYLTAYNEKFGDREDYIAWEVLTEKFVEPLDMVGYNYFYDRYDADSIKYPNRVIWGSETKALPLYDSWKGVMEHPNVLGDFTWTAYDNLGEAGCGRYIWGTEGYIKKISRAGYPWRTCFQGDFELSGFRRPQSYFREAIWKDITPPHIFTVHPCHNGECFSGTGWHWYDVCETWTFDDKYMGEPVQTQVYTTADEVMFYLNDSPVGSAVPEKGIASIEIPYEKGVVTAVPVRKGVEECRFSLATTSAPCIIDIVPEKTEMSADNRDLCYYDIFIRDKDGNVVEEAEHELVCRVTGAELMGIFSGCPNNTDQFGSNKCHAYRGKAVAVIRCENSGYPEIRIDAEGLKSGADNTVCAK